MTTLGADVRNPNSVEAPDCGTMPAISVRNLSKTFKSFIALDNLIVDIGAGEFFMIVGPSGCGKTTLLRILAGLETPSSGGYSVDTGAGAHRPENSMVFQGDSLFPWMTVWDNAAYGLKMRGVPAAQVRETVEHYLDRTGLRHFANSYPHQLSGGMRQRVSIARAFANDPGILLMDEPFSALDAQNKMLLQEELLRIWEEDRKTVLFITHSVDEAVLLGDRIMIMTAQPGRVKTIINVPFGRPRDIMGLQREPEFGHLVHHIWTNLRDEVDRARQQSELAGKAS